jgi:hypothetical protein
MNVVKKVVVSLSILLCVSGVLSYLFYDGNTVRSFVKWGLLFTAIQLCIHQGIIYLADLVLLKKVRKQELDLAITNASSVANLVCPCDRKHMQSVTIGLNKENEYTCVRCAKTVSAKIEVNTVLKTDALPVNTLPKILKEMEDRINE